MRRMLPALCALACVAAFPSTARLETMTNDNPFGVLDFLHWNHDWNNHQYPGEPELRAAIRLMKQAGVGMVRVDFLWQDIEPRRGEFDFAKYDLIVDLLAASGIKVLGLLEYSADWASPTGCWNDPSEDTTAFITYAEAVAQRYKDRVRHWEVWNEPDSSFYWKNQDGLRMYCRMLRRTYTALKKIDPACFILNGGLTYELSSVNRLYDNGGAGYFDALNIHVFENPADPATAARRVTAYVARCGRIMARNGDGAKPIWVTETGCPGVRRGVRVKNWWNGNNPDEKLQALWLTTLYDTLLKDDRVDKVFWAFFRDTKSHWHDGTDYLGIVRNDFTPKPAYDAYRQAYRAWVSRKRKER